MFFLYDLFVIFYLAITSPYYLYQMIRYPHYRDGLPARLGRLSPEIVDRLRGKPVCWIHAVSVGEVNAVADLANKLKQRCPQYAIAVSTVTPTGQQRAKETLEVDAVFYLPLDCGWFLRPVVRKIDPAVFVIVETELWPRLLSILKQRGTKTLLINGRISDRSFPRYRMTRFFWQRVLRNIDIFSMQSERDAQRIRLIGAPRDRVGMTGNMKFDRMAESPSAEKVDALRQKFNLLQGQRLWVAGSTHDGEEEMVLRVYGRLRSHYPNLRLLLAPRRPERSDEIERLIGEKGFEVHRYTRKEDSVHESSVLLLDTTGKLQSIYALCDFALVGKSFFGGGGQNPLEPAAHGKPVVFGTTMENQREAAETLLEGGGAVQAKGEEELQQTLLRWLENPEEALRTGANARKALRSRQGATQRNLELIERMMKEEQNE